MEYRKLGNSGAVVSAYCLGTMTFGAESDEATSFRLMDDYVAAGGNFIDTANVYSAGVSEEIVGRWLKTKPTAAYLLADRKPLTLDQTTEGWAVQLPAVRPSAISSVLVLETGSRQ